MQPKKWKCVFLLYVANTIHKITLFACKKQETTTKYKILHILNASIHLIRVFTSVSGKEKCVIYLKLMRD